MARKVRSRVDRRKGSRAGSNGRRNGENVTTDNNGLAKYIATKADIAETKESLRGLDRAVGVRLDGIERLQEERSLALREQSALIQKAVDKAETAQHNVNTTANEFRKSLEDLTKNQASRPELESIDKRVQALERGASGGSGRSAGADAFKSNLFAILALLISLLTLLWRFKT